jgi:hypothetical protein
MGKVFKPLPLGETVYVIVVAIAAMVIVNRFLPAKARTWVQGG